MASEVLRKLSCGNGCSWLRVRGGGRNGGKKSAVDVHVRHVQIENDAIRQACIERFQKLRTGAECLRIQTSGTHQAHERFADGFFVVNDSDVRRGLAHNGTRVTQ